MKISGIKQIFFTVLRALLLHSNTLCASSSWAGGGQVLAALPRLSGRPNFWRTFVHGSEASKPKIWGIALESKRDRYVSRVERFIKKDDVLPSRSRLNHNFLKRHQKAGICLATIALIGSGVLFFPCRSYFLPIFFKCTTSENSERVKQTLQPCSPPVDEKEIVPRGLSRSERQSPDVRTADGIQASISDETTGREFKEELLLPPTSSEQRNSMSTPPIDVITPLSETESPREEKSVCARQDMFLEKQSNSEDFSRASSIAEKEVCVQKTNGVPEKVLKGLFRSCVELDEGLCAEELLSPNSTEGFHTPVSRSIGKDGGVYDPALPHGSESDEARRQFCYSETEEDFIVPRVHSELNRSKRTGLFNSLKGLKNARRRMKSAQSASWDSEREVIDLSMSHNDHCLAAEGSALEPFHTPSVCISIAEDEKRSPIKQGVKKLQNWFRPKKVGKT